MTWAAFSAHGKLSLRFTSSNMNSLNYQQVLEASLLPYLQQNNTISFVYQQDNAPIHVSRSTKEWLAAHNISILNWLARFPDGNPMENLRSIVAR